MRTLSNPSSRRKARQIQGGRASPNPVRFVTLTFIIMASVAAGTTLGATMIRFELNPPKETAAKEQPNEAVAKQAAPKGTQKTVIAVKTGAVRPLQPETDRAAVATFPAGSDRFGTTTAQPVAAASIALVDRLHAAKTVDGERTGSIQSPAPPVEVAESEDEIIALERKLADEGAEHFNLPEASQNQTVSPPAQQGLRPRQTAKYVNLRAGPDNDAAVLTVVPARTELLAEDNCVHWCAAVYQGQKGYIYKSLFRDTAQ